MWLVKLESAKDRILGVDITGQQVLPCVSALIRDAVESVPFSDEWEVTWSFAQANMV
jgi:hypothetical protein